MCFHGVLPNIYLLTPLQSPAVLYERNSRFLPFFHYFIFYFFCFWCRVADQILLYIKKENRRRVVTLTLEVVTLGKAAEGDEIHCSNVPVWVLNATHVRF